MNISNDDVSFTTRLGVDVEYWTVSIRMVSFFTLGIMNIDKYRQK